jgi:FG-GAP-like repeat
MIHASLLPVSFPLLVLIAPSLAQSATPYPARQFPTGTLPDALAGADFDQDGIADLAVANSGGNKLTLLRGSPLGPIPVPDAGCGPAPKAVTFADLDGDGDPEALVALSLNAQVARLDALPGAGFALPQFHAVGMGPRGIAAADLDLDGDLDVASANAGSNDVTLLRNNAGALTPWTTLTPGQVPYALHAADMNQDGAQDLVLLARGDSAVVVIGAPALTVDAVLNVGPFPVDLTLGDLDGNAHPDFAVASDTGFGPNAYINGASGYQALSIGGQTLSVAIADLDGNGLGEVLHGMEELLAVRVVENPGSLVEPTPSFELGFGGFADSLLALDLDGDGREDIAGVHQTGRSVTWLRGSGAGTSASQGLEVPAVLDANSGGIGYFPDFAQALDFDADGALDLGYLIGGAPQFGKGRVVMQLGNGAGGFAPAVALFDTIPRFNRDFDAADLDGDGDSDLLVSSYSGSFTALDTLEAFLSIGPGVFGPAQTSAAGNALDQVELADLDLDGDLDAVATGVKFTSSMPNGGLSVMLGGPAGSFAAAQQYSLGNCEALDSADIDSDGLPDVVAGTSDSQTFPANARLRLLRGIGGGVLQPSGEWPLTHGVSGLAVADFDRDGDFDVAVAGLDSASGLSAWGHHAGDGSGGFSLAQSGQPGPFVHDLAALDVDADGSADLVLKSMGSLSVWSHAAGAFGPERRHMSSRNEVRIAHGDFDRDGRIELVLPYASVSLPETQHLVVLHEIAAPLPQGGAPFGIGTAGCLAAHGLAAGGVPQVGASNFQLLCTQAPPNAQGLRAIGAQALTQGADPLGLGFLLHVDPFGPLLPLSWSFHSDGSGQATSDLPIPADTGLAGVVLHAQVLWPWSGGCQPSPLGLSSSRGLTLTLQP